MSLAEDIKASIEGNGLMPGKAEIKRMIANNEWSKLSKLFAFTPTLMMLPSGKWVLDWRCVPKRMADILRQDGANKSVIASTRSAMSFSEDRTYPKKTSFRRAVHFHNVQNGICHYCKRPTELKHWSVDHKQPLSRGGSNRMPNLVGCCKTCNGAKACLTYEEFMASDYAPLHGKKDTSRTINLKMMIKKVHTPMLAPKR